ncbi:MAG: glucokinase [Acidobacteriota bacterium]|nr:glucokinase [Acidobacteriota bacterium]
MRHLRVAWIRQPLWEIGGRVKTTNLPWVLDETSPGQALNLNSTAVHLINDLEAMTRAVPLVVLAADGQSGLAALAR